ncbi:MAG: chromate transporter [Clostridiales bacterium]|nr:chromate transporter [Clostridiales bacterium]
MNLLLLMFEFFKIGLFSVGGGLATLPFLYNLAAKDYGWFDTSTLADMIAVSESTPGPMGVNMATYAGYHAAGIIGGICATIALAVPGIIIIIIIYKFLEKFRNNKYVEGVFYALHPAVGALITLACFEVYKSSFLGTGEFFIQPLHLAFFGTGIDIKPIHFALFLVIFGLKMFLAKKMNKKIHPVAVIAAGAVLGAALGL